MIKNFYKQPQLINERGEANKETTELQSSSKVNEKPYLNIVEACDLLGVSKPTGLKLLEQVEDIKEVDANGGYKRKLYNTNEVLKIKNVKERKELYNLQNTNEKLVSIDDLVKVWHVARQTILNAINEFNIVKDLPSSCKVVVENGKTTYLNEYQTTKIKEIISSHHNLASRQVDNVKTSIEIQENFLKAMNDYVKLLETEKAEYKRLCEEQERKIEEDKPLVEFANTVSTVKDGISFSQFAKMTFKELGIGGNTLFRTCRNLNILQSRTHVWNVPYQQYIDAGYFLVIQQKYNIPYSSLNKLSKKTLITGKGQVWLFNKIKKHLTSN